MDTWVPVPKNYESQKGDVFRLTIGLRAPYDVKTINAIVKALTTGETLIDVSPFSAMTAMWSIDDVEAVPLENPEQPVPLSAGQWSNWNLVITARRFQGGTPLAIAVAVILGVLALLVTLCFVTGWTAEKLNKGPIGTAIGDVGHAIGQSFPALILAAFIVGILIYTRKGG